jgi:DNA-binding transcriptional regulator GbsR (MarR family)
MKRKQLPMSMRVLLELVRVRHPVTLEELEDQLGVPRDRVSQALTALGDSFVENTKWKTWRARRLVRDLHDAISLMLQVPR